jgi:hypothetical protein
LTPTAGQDYDKNRYEKRNDPLEILVLLHEISSLLAVKILDFMWDLA